MVADIEVQVIQHITRLPTVIANAKKQQTMKRHIIIFGLILIPLLTFSQADTNEFRYFDKGKNLIGIQFSAGWGVNTTAMSIQLRYGRFWVKKFNAGLQTGYSFSGSLYQAGSLGLFGRYYILNRRLAPFLETSYAYGLSTQNNGAEGTLRQEWNGTGNGVFAGCGLAYTGILKRFGIELYGGYGYGVAHIKNHPTFGTYNYTRSGLTYGLRINFHF